MKRALWIAGVIVLGGSPPSHAFLGRDTVSSLWPDKPVQIDGRAVEWSDMPVVEDSGMSFRAMNDASYLYLLIRGTTADGRVLLAGNYRQNMTFWILKPDHKSNAWGINLDFGRAHAPAPDMPPTLVSYGIEPERVLPEGLEVSTGTFPQDFEFQADLSSQRGRQPIYEVRIPLSMIDYKNRTIYIDVVSSEISPEVKAELQSTKPEEHASEKPPEGGGQSPAGGGGGRHHRGGGGSHGGSSAASSVGMPKPVHLHLTIELKKEPKH